MQAALRDATGVVVAGDEFDPAHSVPDEIIEERPLMHFGFGQGDGDAWNATPSLAIGADSTEERGIAYHAVAATRWPRIFS